MNGYYETAGFELVTPLTDVTMKRGAVGDNTLIYIQKEHLGVEAGQKIITNEITKGVDGMGKPTVTSVVFAEEGVAGTRLKDEVVTYTAMGARAWDYTLTRVVRMASVDAAGVVGDLVLTENTQEVYADFSLPASTAGGDQGMKRLMSRTEAFGVSPQLTTYEYYDEPDHSSIHGRLKSETRPDGSWNYYEYTMGPAVANAIITEYSSWKDVPMTNKAGARKTVTTVEANALDGDTTSTDTFVEGHLVAQSRTTLKQAPEEPREITTTSEQYDGSGENGWHKTTTIYHADNAAAPNAGRPKRMTRPDGTTVDYTYAGSPGQEDVTAVDSAGTTVVTTYGLGGVAIAQTTRDGTLPIESWVGASFDASGRPTRRNFNADPDDFEEMRYACCGLEFSRTRDGRETEYFYDPLKRVKKMANRASANSPTVWTISEINGLTSTQWRQVGNGPQLFLGTVTNTLDGLTQTSIGPSNTVVSPAAEAARPVTTSVTAHIAGTGDTTTTTDAGGGIAVTTRYLDGQVKAVTGTAVADMTYSYDTHAENGGGLVASRTTVGLTSFTYNDMLGRTFKTVDPATGTTTTTYHPMSAAAGARGKMAGTTDADGVAVSYGYNAKGEQTTTTGTVPVTVGNVTTATPLVTTTLREVRAAETVRGIVFGTHYRTTQQIAGITTSESFTSINGLLSGSRSFGRETVTSTTRPNNNGEVTQTSIATDGTSTVTTITHGLTTSVVDWDSAAPNPAAIRSTTYGYDALQRPLTVTDSRTGVTTYGVTGAATANVTESGLPLKMTKARGLLTDVTETTYDALGRPVQTKLPDNTLTHTSYYLTGLVKARWGSQTYPEFHIYDEANRRTELRTYKNLNAEPTFETANFATTRWLYHPTRGLLVEKNYQDENDNGTVDPDYTYTAAGRLHTRTWERGITATYVYTHGFQTLIDYSGDTRDVTTTYDALGRIDTITQASQSRIKHTYDADDLSLDTEIVSYDLNHDGTYDFTRTLDHSDDGLGRNTGYVVKNGDDSEFSASVAYHPQTGRLATVGNDTQTLTYGYEPNSHLVHTVTGPVHVATSNWEDHRDVLASKVNTLAVSLGGAIRSRYTYEVNEIGQRTKLDTTFNLGGSVPANPGATVWGYDPLGQVESANAPGTAADRLFQYDTIGNRKKSAVGAAPLPATDNYTTNPLNQYSATPTPLPTPVYDYDLDGNATAFPLKPLTGVETNVDLAWDAENRLTSTTPVSGNATTYQYDARGRRIAKITNGIQTVFLYDGWNLIAEYTGASLALRGSFLWGSDLSGSMQGAGGVGGLLAARLHTGSTGVYYPTYDGNGNVSEYLDSNGDVAAHYEYGPFGEPLVTTGTVAAEMPFRFSTHYTDQETGLLYAKRRYYSPVTGRWLSRDPLEEEGGANLYGYALNSPTDFFDPFGMVGSGVVVTGDGWVDMWTGKRGTYTGSGIPQDAYDLGVQWLLGVASRNLTFGNGTKIANEMTKAPEMGDPRKALLSQLKTNCAGAMGAKADFGRSLFKEGYWDNMAYPLDFAHDVSGRNPSRAFLGSFSGKAVVTKTDCQKCCATVKFSIDNDAGWESATRLPRVGYTKMSDGATRQPLIQHLWEDPWSQLIARGIVVGIQNRPWKDLAPRSLLANDIFGSFGRTIHMTIEWEETLCWGNSSGTSGK